MSGFVGLWQRDGRPVDPALLAGLTESLRFRGPDGLATWRRGAVGLGHARFTTHAARDGEAQPLGLDDRYWIAGHIRLDAREELIASLCHSERSEESRHAGDATLVLRAYRAWGPDCVTHIHGDFAFAIWDKPAQRLFCARDRFGVRPLFYAAFPGLVLVSNTLETLRRHPQVGADPYEPALADYLVIGNLLEPDRSFYRDIGRLPPAHTLTLETGAPPRLDRYWSLPVETPLRYRDSTQYTEQFTELLSRAVAERSPSSAVTLFLSGGLDSAAIGTALRTHAGAAAISLGWNRVFTDPEPELARATARALDLPLTVHEFADCEPFRGWDSAAGIGPEPEDDFYRANTLDSLTLAAARSRVALYGRGGDEVFAPETLADELRRGAGLSACAGAATTWLRTRRRPSLGLRSLLRRASLPWWVGIPDWLEPRWLEPLVMAERLRALAPPDPNTPRANARYRLASARWTAGFEFGDAGYTGVPVECRYPFMNERLVGFALRVPPLPWCADKLLPRQALAPALPKPIVRRRKAPLAGEPLRVWADRHPGWLPTRRDDVAALNGRVSLGAWQDACAAPLGEQERGIGLWRLVRVSALARWLDVTRPAYAALRAVA